MQTGSQTGWLSDTFFAAELGVAVGVLSALLVIFALLESRVGQLLQMEDGSVAKRDAVAGFNLERRVLTLLVGVAVAAIFAAAAGYAFSSSMLRGISLIFTGFSLLGIVYYSVAASRWVSKVLGNAN